MVGFHVRSVDNGNGRFCAQTCRDSCHFQGTFVMPFWFTVLLGAQLCAAAQLPNFSLVEREAKSHFTAIKGHQADDIISRDQVEALLDRLADIGWDVEDRDEILHDVPAKGDPLVKKLRTKNGQKFMRQSASFPNAFDRLDHLQKLSDGPQILDRLIDGPDGYKLIEYLTTSSGGSNMGKMLSNAPRGEKFNKPTGRIYTQAHLLTRLKDSHDAAQRTPASASGKTVR